MLYPFSMLYLKQEVLFRPLVKSTGQTSSSDNLDISHEIRLNYTLKYDNSFWLVLLAEYSLLPLKYDILSINPQENFSTQTIKSNEEVYTYMTKIIFKKLGLSIGYGQKVRTGGGYKEQNENILSIGFDRSFQ